MLLCLVVFATSALLQQTQLVLQIHQHVYYLYILVNYFQSNCLTYSSSLSSFF